MNEPISTPGDGPDEHRCLRIVAERLAQFGNRLCEGIPGYIGACPQAVKERLLGDEVFTTLDEKEQQVEEPGGQVEGRVTAHDAVTRAVKQKWTEPIGRKCHAE